MHRHEVVEHAQNEALHHVDEEHHVINVVDIIQLEVATAITRGVLPIIMSHEHCVNGEDVVARSDHAEVGQALVKDIRLSELVQHVSGVCFSWNLLRLHDPFLEQLLHVHVSQLNVSCFL